MVKLILLPGNSVCYVKFVAVKIESIIGYKNILEGSKFIYCILLDNKFLIMLRIGKVSISNKYRRRKT